MKQRAADLGSNESPEGTALPCILASLVLLFGVLGLLDGPWVTRILGSRVGLHALFGLFLYTLVAVRFHSGMNWAAPAPPSDIRRLSRELSRMVYLSLYAVIGLRQLVSLADWSSHGGSMQFAKLSDVDLQAILAYGIAGLFFIRLLAVGTWLRGARLGGNDRRRALVIASEA